MNTNTDRKAKRKWDSHLNGRRALYSLNSEAGGPELGRLGRQYQMGPYYVDDGDGIDSSVSAYYGRMQVATLQQVRAQG